MIDPAQQERVARAIRDVVANRSGRGKDWEELPEQLRKQYLAEAKAAIEAISHV